MGTENIDVQVNATIDKHAIREMVEKAVANGDIRIELSDELIELNKPGGFTVDKTKYRIRLSDETEESVKVWIEPKD